MNTYLEYAVRGRNDWWRYLVALVLAVLLASLIGLVLVTVMLLAHVLPPDLAEQMRQPKNIAPFFLGIGISFGILAASLAVAVAIVHRKHPKDLIGAWRWQFFALGLCAWMAVQAVLALIDLVIAPDGFALTANRGTLSLAMTAFAGILAQTFAEEFIFRGYVTQGLLLAFKRPWPAATVSGLLFGSLHIANGAPQAVNAAIFGIVCAFVAIRTGGIALTCGVHLANNYFGAVFVVSGSDVFLGSPGIVSQTTPQLAWWDLLLAAGALAGLLWLVARRSYFSADAAG